MTKPGSQKGTVIPGISEAEGLDYSLHHSGIDGDAGSTELADVPSGTIDDAEAEYKNLTPVELPHSMQHGADQASREQEPINKMAFNGNKYTDRLAGRKKSSKVSENAQDPQFDQWRKEFKNALKRVSSLSKKPAQRLKRHSAVDQKIVPEVPPPNNFDMDDRDLYTQKLASDLLDSLLAGCPGALFASTQFLRDEHGQRRAPLVLAMLGVKVEPLTINSTSDINDIHVRMESNFGEDGGPLGIENDQEKNRSRSSSSSSDNKEKPWAEYSKRLFKIHLEYGIGKNRLKWSIIRSYKELSNLHARLKLVSFQQNTVKKLYIDHNRYHKIHIPHFPHIDDLSDKLHHIRRIKQSDKGNGPEVHHDLRAYRAQGNSITSSGIANDISRTNSIRSSMDFSMDQIKVKHLQDLIDEKEDESKPMYLRIERYLRLLNIALCLRPQSNRLFQFYELSPVGNLLSYEDGPQGKQGYLIIRSTARSQGWRVSHFRFNDFKEMIERHTTKWFLVRHSYIMYVSDLYSTTPLDVFLIDHKFQLRTTGSNRNVLEDNDVDSEWHQGNPKKISTNLLITLENSERKLQMICKSEASLRQWTSSIKLMAKLTPWSKRHRFDSFAPIRKNVFMKFLIDGRDYFWALSEALSMAEDVIYIHDWWLSPELYMRRPVNGNQQYRIDRILKERAERGVKIFIIVYRNVGNTVGTDSLWTKHSMLALHPNIHLIRSPNQWLQNTYFWAHHEKMTVIDNTVAFMGGIDLCYGRYDTPEHVLRDDQEKIPGQVFPGKDYSNARICDFYDLDKPFESMYDRSLVARMPWHDVHTMTIGEAARDMARHFVQRWNYLLRQKRPSRPTPLLTPVSDFTEEQLKYSPFFQMLKPRATCEVQVIRSAGYWSLGLKETEHSIQNAYLKLIETSEHYIYIENQFFVTTSQWDGVVIENKLGDAIVDRVIKANSEGKSWKAFILIPIMPGFDSPIDQPEASSLRVIMQCQYQSISRGETSIFSRLRKLNIDPLQYVQFYSLRKWSTLGPSDKLVTEELYVHGKVLIVDDRACIIGSANINERSQLGNRDSEVAAIIRDTDLVKSKMEDKEYYAGRFPWELRQRLMREHLGCDVDSVEVVERKFGRLKDLAEKNYKTLHLLGPNASDAEKQTSAMIELAYREVFEMDYSKSWGNMYSVYPEIFESEGKGVFTPNGKKSDDSKVDLLFNPPIDSMGETSKKTAFPKNGAGMASEDEEANFHRNTNYHSFNYRAGEDNLGIRGKKPISSDPRITNDPNHLDDVNGLGPDGWRNVTKKFKESVTDQLRIWAVDALSTKTIDGKRRAHLSFLPDRADIEDYLQAPHIPLENRWDMLKRVCYLQHLSHRKQKREQEHLSCQRQEALQQKRMQSVIVGQEELDEHSIDELLAQLAPRFGDEQYSVSSLLNLNFIDPYSFEDPMSTAFAEDLWFSVAMRNSLLFRLVFHCQPDNAVQTWRDFKDYKNMALEFDENQDKQATAVHNVIKNQAHEQLIGKDAQCSVYQGQSLGDLRGEEIHVQESGHELTRRAISEVKKGNPSKVIATKMRFASSLLYGYDQRVFDKQTARRMLERIHGHLVIFPTEWLAREVESKNWFYSADRLPPIEIYD
ncbi:phospholipase D1 [Zygosaccharomyces mellis]|uniref:Phospholipase n=1 Tax=Zygosaccharomyces mellis TaxID=42258 RepID=A0A4C2EC22_9SACH|nr:phospholipase D1 [Zygosaccharomyces mellis]